MSNVVVDVFFFCIRISRLSGRGAIETIVVDSLRSPHK